MSESDSNENRTDEEETIDFSRVEKGDSVVVDVEWGEESLYSDGQVEMKFEDYDAENSEIIVEGHEGYRRYRISDSYDEELVRIRASQHCATCGQHYWPSHGVVNDVEFIEYTEEDQITLSDIAD